MKKISDFNNATEKYPVIYAGSATRPEFVDMPTTLQQQEGVAPMDTLPAQWWNAMWKLATKDINAFRDYVGDAFTEINNLLTKFGITIDDADSEQLYDFFHNDYVQNYLNDIFVNKSGDTIDGDLNIKSNLNVDGNNTINGDLHVKSNLNVDGNIDGNNTINGDLNVKSNLNVDGNNTINGDLNVKGNLNVDGNNNTIDGDLHIKGNLSVDGIGEEIISTELKVGANTITLRNGNPSALGNTELAGVVTENYDGNNHNNIISIDKNGIARTGDIDIATRILYSNNGTNFFTDEGLTIPATIGETEEVRDTGNQTSGGVKIYEGITYSNNDTQPLATREENPKNGAIMLWDENKKRLVSGSTPNAIIDANSRFEYKDITAMFDAGTVSQDISNNDFSKYSLGNYIKKTITIPAYKNGTNDIPDTTVTVRIVFAHFNLFYSGELPDVGVPYTEDFYSNTMTPHIACIICDLPNCAMNSSDTTVGGYLNSYMHSTFLSERVLTALSGIGITISDHLVKHKKLLTNSIINNSINRWGSPTGCSNNFEWKDEYISLMSEIQLFGSIVWSSSGFDTGEANEKLAIFNFIRPNKLFGNKIIWLRDVSSSAGFTRLDNGGIADGGSAGVTYVAPAPLILLK